MVKGKMEDQQLKNLFSQVNTIALLGASAKPERASNKVMAFLLNQGYQVFPVNPVLVGTEIHGCQVFASIDDIPEKIDMLDVFRQPKYLYGIVQDAIKANIPYVWGQLGVMDKQAESLAQENGITLVVDRCPAIEIPRLKI